LKTFEVKEEIERGVKVHNWPHIILKNNAWHRIKTIYYFNCNIRKSGALWQLSVATVKDDSIFSFQIVSIQPSLKSTYYVFNQLFLAIRHKQGMYLSKHFVPNFCKIGNVYVSCTFYMYIYILTIKMSLLQSIQNNWRCF
jgi:hypothetical protein